jgi:hypothetical protein
VPGLDVPGLGPTWWRSFTTELTAGLVATSRPDRWAA